MNNFFFFYHAFKNVRPMSSANAVVSPSRRWLDGEVASPSRRWEGSSEVSPSKNRWDAVPSNPWDVMERRRQDLVARREQLDFARKRATGAQKAARAHKIKSLQKQLVDLDKVQVLARKRNAQLLTDVMDLQNVAMGQRPQVSTAQACLQEELRKFRAYVQSGEKKWARDHAERLQRQQARASPRTLSEGSVSSWEKEEKGMGSPQRREEDRRREEARVDRGKGDSDSPMRREREKEKDLLWRETQREQEESKRKEAAERMRKEEEKERIQEKEMKETLEREKRKEEEDRKRKESEREKQLEREREEKEKKQRDEHEAAGQRDVEERIKVS